MTGSQQRIGRRLPGAVLIGAKTSKFGRFTSTRMLRHPSFASRGTYPRMWKCVVTNATFLGPRSSLKLHIPLGVSEGLHVPPEIVSNHSSPGTRLEAPDLLLDTVFKEARIPGCESLNFRHVAVLRQIQLRGPV